MKFTGRRVKTICCLIALTISINSIGQLCQGSLGDPVVNIDFGTGNNFGSPLPSNIISYNYTAGECPNDGNYTIASSTRNCFGSTWLPVSEDHTPNDNNGYMIVANASFTAGDFYVQTVTGLCGGTTYEFAAWLANVLTITACGGNGTKPNVTFQIETTSGAILLSNKTGDIPSEVSVTWKQYGAFFTMPENTSSVVIRMTNNAPGGCGNDLLLDDITFRPCGALVNASIAGETTITKDVCVGESASFNLTGNAVSTDKLFYQWQSTNDSGSTWMDISGANSKDFKSPAVTALGSYLYRLSISKGSSNSATACRVASNVIKININTLPGAQAANDGPVCEGKTLSLTSSGGVSYLWSGPNNFTANTPVVAIVDSRAGHSGKYYVTVTSDKGCKAIDSTIATVNRTVTVDAGIANHVICEGQTIILEGSGSADGDLLWTPANSLSADNIARPIASPVDTTMYILTVSNGGCSISDTTTVNVIKKAVANAGPDKEMLEGEAVVLNGTASGTDVSFFWSPNPYISSTSILQPNANPPADQTYTLNVVSNRGCASGSDNVIVKVFRKITVPNAFSPNGDGVNDSWLISQISLYPDAQISVFNRWGHQVYSSKGLYKPWDGTSNGKTLPIGTYYYVIDLRVRALRHSGWVFIAK